MRKFLTLLLSVILVLGMIGCGKKQEEVTEEVVQEDFSAIKKEIVQMVNNDIPSIAHDRDSAVEIYNNYFKKGANIDSETWLGQLEGDALVSYDRYMKNLEALTYQSSEVMSLKDIFVKSASSQRDAIQNVIDSIKAGNPGKLDTAKQSINDSITYLKMYEDELDQLCTKYGIKIVGEFQSSSLTVDTTVTTETETTEETATESSATPDTPASETDAE